MNEKNRDKMVVLVLSDDLNKVQAAFSISMDAAIKGIDVSMFFMACGIKALKNNAKLYLKGILFPFSAIAVRVMEAHGIERIGVQIQNAKDLGVSLYACRTCANILRLGADSLTPGVEITERSRYIDFLQEAKYHNEIC